MKKSPCYEHGQWYDNKAIVNGRKELDLDEWMILKKY